MNRSVNLYKNFLGNIFSILYILDNTHNRIKDSILESFNQVFKGLLIPITQSLYQFNFAQWIIVKF